MGRVKIHLDIDKLKELYEAGKSVHSIGELLGINYQTVHNRMKELNIPRRKYGETKKGKPHTPEHAARIGDALRGIPLSAERRKNISKAVKGRPAFLKGKRKVSNPEIKWNAPTGNRHWNWQGGISAINNRIRQSSEYKEWRFSVFKRDNFTCVKCGHISKGDIEADHIKSFTSYPDLRFDVNNGQTLCISCHKEKTKIEQERDNGGKFKKRNILT